MDDDDHRDCRDCRAGLEHCHGTLIHHPLRGPECTDGGCIDTAVIRHAFAVGCDAAGCRCADASALAV